MGATYHVRVLILLPPSEGKTAPASGPSLDLDSLLDAERLTTARREVMSALAGVSRSAEAASVLGLGPRSAEQVGINLSLETSPCVPAHRLFTGVLYEAAGLDSIRQVYDKKALYYQRYWDHETKLMRPVMADGKFRTPFNPRFSAHEKSDYTEGNAYQWSFYAPHDMEGFLKLMGGKAVLEQNLDTLFTTSSRIDGAEQSGDITGLIGQYAHGNEPSHLIAYLYNYTDSPHKGQAILDTVLRHIYQPTPEGIIGNEDCGQMSAWYIFSALGFYPVCPATDQYAIGAPLFRRALLHLTNGRTVTLSAPANSDSCRYIGAIRIDGKSYTKTYFTHDELLQGPIISFDMRSQPVKTWGTGAGDVPYSFTNYNYR
mgnify:CR=1 FL=1